MAKDGRRAGRNGVRPDVAWDPRARELWARIRAERPAADMYLRGSFALANEVRDWAYEHAVAASRPFLLDAGGDYAVYQQPASRILERMEANEGGFMCGGVAAFLRQTYRALGFRAFAVDLGEEGTVGTHVVTLVEVSEAGVPCITIQDAYLNYALTDDAGDPLSWRAAIARARAGKFESIELFCGRTHRRRVLLGRPEPGELNAPGFAEWVVEAAGRGEILPGGRALYETGLFTPEAFATGPWFESWRRARRARFATDSLLSLLLLPRSTSGEAEAEALVFGPPPGRRP
ncbi:MAG: hypothetical protein HYX53_13835 [Chloroflexi bacterium]|nr:hypothetical protein [Chloroflexota bacterium]